MDSLTLQTITRLPHYTLGTLYALGRLNVGTAVRTAFAYRAAREGKFPFQKEIERHADNPAVVEGIFGGMDPACFSGAIAEIKTMLDRTVVIAGVVAELLEAGRFCPFPILPYAELERIKDFNSALEQDLLRGAPDIYKAPLGQMGVDLIDPYDRGFSEEYFLVQFQTSGDEQSLIWAIREKIRSEVSAERGEAAIAAEIGKYFDLFSGASGWGVSRFSAVSILRNDPAQIIQAYKRGLWLCRKLGQQFGDLIRAYASLPRSDDLAGDNIYKFIDDFVRPNLPSK